MLIQVEKSDVCDRYSNCMLRYFNEDLILGPGFEDGCIVFDDNNSLAFDELVRKDKNKREMLVNLTREDLLQYFHYIIYSY